MQKSNCLLVAFALGSAMAFCGCGTKAKQPMYTPEEQQKRYVQEMSGEVKRLIAVEKKYGLNHSQVRQMKIEMGMNPDKPAEGQEPGTFSKP